jgi:CHAT domain-containing protein
MASDLGATGSHITPYDRLTRSEAEFTILLASGRERVALSDFFGEQLYAELAALAKQIERKRIVGGRRVYVLPGIMGSQLGVPREPPRPADILWIDPIDIAFGRLPELALTAANGVAPMGVLLYGHLKLQLQLRVAGFDPVLWDYDWRQGIDASGARLAADIANDRAENIAILAHSMGGLVARHALTHAASPRVTQLVLLGTPNFGSLASVQALRGTYSVVRKIAMLDMRHSAEELAERVFRGFPSLYHLLPAAGAAGPLDLFDTAAWPTIGPQPDSQLLRSCAGIEQLLAPPDPRFSCIIGHGRPTATRLERRGDDFAYTYTLEGDGTVPTALANLPGTITYFAAAAHSDLPRTANVIEAMIDILQTGRTSRLSSRVTRRVRMAATWTDRQLRSLHTDKVNWPQLTPEQRRQFLDSLNEPPSEAAADIGNAPASGGARPALKRRASRAQALRVAVHVGDVAQFRAADAIAVAAFRGVRPLGAVAALDGPLRGAIAELYEHRMLSAEAGVVTPVAALGLLGRARTVLLAGLGSFENLGARVIEQAAENVSRWCLRGEHRHLAVTVWGAGSGLDIETGCNAQVGGLLAALDSVPGGFLERLTFVARDTATARRILRAIESLAQSLVAERASVALKIVRPKAPKPARSVALAASSKPRLVYLWIDALQARGDQHEWRTALLTAGREAAVISQRQPFAARRLERLTHRLQSSALTSATVRAVGAAIPQLVLHPTVVHALRSAKGQPLAVVHDREASRVPWETLNIRGWFPALDQGVSRRFQSSEFVPARFDPARREDRVLNVLLVANPTRDLPGAELERSRMIALLRRLPRVEVVEVRERAATVARVAAELEAGRYDLMHYAGHAFFDERRPEESGLTLADGDLTGSALARATRLPPLMVFNACESSRVRRATGGATTSVSAESSRAAGVARNIGLAETLLRAGVANYIGTHWPVGDAAATEFATVFYARLLKGLSIGTALLAARRAIHAQRLPDWADYVHYGDPDFVLKRVR